MKRLNRHFILSLLIFTTMLMCLLSVTAYAKTVSKVKLTFSGTTPKIGDSPGSISCSVGTGYSVSGCNYLNGVDYWEAGDTPVVQVDLRTDTNYYFTKDTSGYFTISGMGARFSSADLNDDRTTLTVVVTLKKVSSQSSYELSVPGNLDWNGKTATWSPVDDATSYDIWVYRDSSLVLSRNVTNTSTSVASGINMDGDYTFKVRACRGSLKGDWAESYSASFTGVTPSDDSGSSSGSGSGTNSGSGSGPGSSSGGNGPGSKSGSSGSGSKPGNPSAAGWNHSPNGWWYLNQDGTFPYNAWQKIADKWYLFDAKGYMLTGWVLRDNLYYYLGSDGALYINTTTPDGYRVNNDGVRIFSTADQQNISNSIPSGKVFESEGWRYYYSNGQYLTNEWKKINGKWYHFDDHGYSKIGWYLENGLYYYFGEDGAMLTNTTTPDGHYVNADGVMVQ